MSALALRRFQAGFSLVELMVGMLIGLIGIVIITHLYITNDQYKRSTSGSGTAQVNGAVALYTLERELRMAGYGFNHSAALACTCAQPNCSPLQYYYNANSSFPPAPASVGALPPRSVAPVLIGETPGAPDTLTVLYGVTNERMLPAQLSEAAQAPNYTYKVDVPYGFADNDMILVTQNGTCLLKQISKVQVGTLTLDHIAGPFSPTSASFGPALDTGAVVFNLGAAPVWRTFSIGNTGNTYRLQSEDILRSLAAGVPQTQQLVDDIVDLQAQYGKDDGSAPGSVAEDGIVDAWDTAPPVDPANPAVILWRRVIAVRVGVLARSQNFEKPTVAGGACEATQAAPTWSGGAFNVPGGLPSCYKHRVFETVIPLRNMIWRPA